MRSLCVSVVLIAVLLLGDEVEPSGAAAAAAPAEASEVKKAEEDRDAFQLLQLKLFSEITNFANTWVSETPKCQVLAYYTRHTVDRFFDQADHPDKYRALDELNQKNCAAQAQELGCEKDSANMWKRYASLHKVFEMNNAQLNKVIERLTRADKQMQDEKAASGTAAV